MGMLLLVPQPLPGDLPPGGKLGIQAGQHASEALGVLVQSAKFGKRRGRLDPAPFLEW